jgi:hypothetical protein
VDGKIDPSWDIIEQEKIELADGGKGSFICFLQRKGIL